MSDKQIIRLDDNGAVDDVVITGDLFRMERMSDGVWWVCIYRDGKRVAFSLSSSALITATVNEDDLGCVDDSRGGQQP